MRWGPKGLNPNLALSKTYKSHSGCSAEVADNKPRVHVGEMTEQLGRHESAITKLSGNGMAVLHFLKSTSIRMRAYGAAPVVRWNVSPSEMFSAKLKIVSTSTFH